MRQYNKFWAALIAALVTLLAHSEVASDVDLGPLVQAFAPLVGAGVVWLVPNEPP